MVNPGAGIALPQERGRAGSSASMPSGPALLYLATSIPNCWATSPALMLGNLTIMKQPFHCTENVPLQIGLDAGAEVILSGFSLAFVVWRG